MNSPARIGVFGGTFDPIHKTHIDIAHAALEESRLGQVLFVVAASPPHKDGEVHAPAEDRLVLVEAALRDQPRMSASRIELDREGPSYTADTLAALQQQHPGTALFLIVGRDSLVDLVNWRRPEAILAQAHVLAVPRPGAGPAVPPLLEGHYTLLPFTESPVSSTQARERLWNGEDAAALLDPEVLRIIKEKGLYHAPRQDGAL